MVTMSLEFNKEEFKLICRLVEETCGICYDESKEYLIKTRLGEFFIRHNLLNYRDVYQSLSSNKLLLDEAISLLTTGETFWFRDTPIWEGMQSQLLLPLLYEVASGKKDLLNIWSCACSTGQEPYSLGIALYDLMERNNLSQILAGKIRIYASDISQHALEVARHGMYSTVAFERGPKDKIIRHFEFDKHTDKYKISSKIKSMVTFEKINLLDSFQHRLPKMDLILCRNVAIYFSEHRKIALFGRLTQVLSPDGTILLGSSETVLRPDHPLIKDKRYSIVCYCPK